MPNLAPITESAVVFPVGQHAPIAQARLWGIQDAQNLESPQSHSFDSVEAHVAYYEAYDARIVALHKMAINYAANQPTRAKRAGAEVRVERLAGLRNALEHKNGQQFRANLRASLPAVKPLDRARTAAQAAIGEHLDGSRLVAISIADLRVLLTASQA